MNIERKGLKQKMTEIRTGKSIHGGIAIGKIKVFIKEQGSTAFRKKVTDTEEELLRFETAKKRALIQLRELVQTTQTELGKDQAGIFEAHVLLLEDEAYNNRIRDLIRREHSSAEYAVKEAGEHYAAGFEAMEDAYLNARAADIREVSERVIQNLTGKSLTESDDTVDHTNAKPEHYILLADQLSSSELAARKKSDICAIVLKECTEMSHMAILIRAMDITAIYGISAEESLDGKLAIVDGNAGRLIIDPDIDTLKEYQEKKALEEREKNELKSFIGKETFTADGRKVSLYANIRGLEDTKTVLENDAEGIGLFRSEYLCINEKVFPSEEKQFRIYKKILEIMKGKKVIIRTFDIGADKSADCFEVKNESNPALGYRGIRISLTRQEIFAEQLRALYRASVFGNLAIMYPMISSLEEVQKIREISCKVKQELLEEKIPFGNVEEGIMIETPAAALMSQELAQEVDFFSIGTNDLTQYTLAMDRDNAKLNAFYNIHHPAVLKLIRMTVENAHEMGIKVGICGELAADFRLTELFLQMGIDELSVSPERILPMRKQISRIK